MFFERINFNHIKIDKLLIIHNILKNRPINSKITDQQIAIEKALNDPINYQELFDKYGQDNIYKLKYEEIINKLNKINYYNVIGKTYIKEILNIITVKTLNELIISRFLIIIKGISKSGHSALKDRLKSYILDVIYRNKLVSYYKELNIRYLNNITIPKKGILKKKNKVNSIITDEYLDNLLNIIDHGCSYIIEALKSHELIKWDPFSSRYILINLNLDLTLLTIIIKNKWPLIISPKNYYYNTEYKEYRGGYYVNELPLNIKNYRSKKIEINEKGIDIINNYQNKGYYLINNKTIYEFLSIYGEQLASKINKTGYTRTYYAEKRLEDITTKVKLIFTDNLENDIEDWYSIYQYMTFLENSIYKIYYPYQIDYRGRIYNGLGYGLNPTSNKLSRFLLGYGKYKLTEKSKLNLKKYIYKILKIKSDIEFNNKCEKVQTDINNRFCNINIENLENLEINAKEYILIIDWLTNVEITNETEIMIEIDATQSGFQMLSLFANDEKGMLDTNLILKVKEDEEDEEDENIEDLYNKILKQLDFPKEAYLILTRKIIKKVIMTIPYGSTISGQKTMIIEAFNKEYGVEHLLYKNEISRILNSNVLTNKDIINRLQKLQYEVNKIMDKSNLTNLINLTNLPNYEIKKEIGKCHDDINLDLNYNFAKNLVYQINKILKSEYPLIIDFGNNLKLNYKDYNDIETEYYKYNINYYSVIIRKLRIFSSEYSTYSVNCNKFNDRKKKQGIVANLCHGLGDAFIIYKLLSYNISIYTIHDAILCKSTDIENIQNLINTAYNEVYIYINKKNMFNNEINNKYNINSNKIFK
jgi:hypothetical protein